MKKFALLISLLLLTVVFSVKESFAVAPFTNLEGVGGVAFNPLAYLADSDGENSHLKIGDTDFIGKPRFGVWYVNLHNVHVDWTSIGASVTLLKRVEVSYGYQSVN